MASGGWGLGPQTSSVLRLNYSTLLYSTHVSQFRHFCISTIGLSPLLKRVLSYIPTPGHGFWSSILCYLCPHKEFLFQGFWWRHCMWFVVWAPLLPIKNSGYAYAPYAMNILLSLSIISCIDFLAWNCSLFHPAFLVKLSSHYLKAWSTTVAIWW